MDATTKPCRKNTATSSRRDAPMVPRIATSRRLSLTSMAWPETMLKAAMATISAKSANMMAFSIFTARNSAP